MRPNPPWLPSPNSRKWHVRRFWDPLGYLRARTLANPRSGPQPDRVIRMAAYERERISSGNKVPAPGDPAPLLHALDDLLRDARRYRSGAGGPNDESEWDLVLESLDHYLEVLQADHAARVQEAKSGESEPSL